MTTLTRQSPTFTTTSSRSQTTTQVATHVLCSVDDIEAVLRQASRALRPGGRYYFLEHIQADAGSYPLLHFVQLLFQPIFTVVANGCRFRSLQEYLTAPTATLPDSPMSGFELPERNEAIFDAPLPIPLLVPHIRGVAVKRTHNHT